MKKKKNKKKNIIKKYNDARAKKNLKVTGMKTGVDLVAGVGVGTLAGSALGSLSPFIGILLMGIGHFAGDESGVIRLTGASMAAYGLASAVENRNIAQATTVNGISLGSVTEGTKTRLLKLKENWKHAFYLDKIGGKKTDVSAEKAFGAIDMEALDNLEAMVKRSAVQYEADRITQEDNSLLELNNPTVFEDETGSLVSITSPSLDGHFLEDDQEFDFSTM